VVGQVVFLLGEVLSVQPSDVLDPEQLESRLEQP
jgi:hypothetical protein